MGIYYTINKVKMVIYNILLKILTEISPSRFNTYETIGVDHYHILHFPQLVSQYCQY